MAKKIKVIQCNQCGSTDAVLVSKNNYKCNACNTTFFLNDEYININVIQTNRQRPNFLKWIVIGIISCFVFILGLITLGYLVLKNNKDNNKFYTEIVKDRNIYYYSPKIFISKAGKPILIATQDIRNVDEDEQLSLIIKNLCTGEIIAKQELKLNNHIFDTRTFNDGSVYIITEDKKTLYYIDRESYNFIDVTEEMFSKHKEFASGLSSVEFVYKDFGDGFKVLTNIGKELYFYPVIDKVLTYDQFHTYQISNGYKVETIYKFNKENPDSQNTESLHLYKIDYKYDGGVEALKIYRGSSRYSEEMLFSKGIISSTDVTPDRSYIKPKVLFFDNQEILIGYLADLKEGAPLVVQSLSIPSMNIKWSLNLDSTVELRPGYSQSVDLISAIKTNNNYFVSDQSNVYYKITDDGQLMDILLYNR